MKNDRKSNAAQDINEKLINHIRGALLGTNSEQDNREFTRLLIDIANGATAYKQKVDPVWEAIETIELFLDELDENCGLLLLQYGPEAGDAIETIRSWYIEQLDKFDDDERNCSNTDI